MTHREKERGLPGVKTWKHGDWGVSDTSFPVWWGWKMTCCPWATSPSPTCPGNTGAEGEIETETQVSVPVIPRKKRKVASTGENP